MRRVILLATILLLSQAAPSAPAQNEARSMEGTWQGTLDAGGAQLRVVLNVTRAPDGGFSATLDSPDQGAAGIPVDSLNRSGAVVRFEIKSIGGAYEGELNQEGTPSRVS